MIRKPAAIGYFYPAGLSNINDVIASFNVPQKKVKIDAFGIISPHAGYVYSGKTAFMGYSEIIIKKNIIIIGPNHTGLGADFSIMDEGSYNFGDFNIPINSELAKAVVKEKNSPFKVDESAQLKEHSIEVQIPLIHYIKQDFSIVPIVVSFVRYDDVVKAAASIFNAIKRLGLLNDVLIVASSDMTHYESAGQAKIKDEIAISEILKLNPDGLYNKVRDNNISMCGFIPASIMINIAKMADRTNAKLINYTNSGESSGDYSSVVGYSSIIVY
jgi:hypothetical protein